MNDTELKHKMTALWKETFHDSDEYISLIFSKYYNPELIEYEIIDNELAAGLLGIPYEFGGENCRIKGLYLCGLATRQRHRGQGIMSRLIEKINKKAAEKGFAFTFLIPSGERLERYYSHHGYVNAFYRCERNYTCLHDFKQEYESVLELRKDKVSDLKRRYYGVLEGREVCHNAPNGVLEKIKNIIFLMENGQFDMEVFHGPEHVDTIIEENRISGGKMYYTVNAQEDITAVAFTMLVDRSRVDVERIYSLDECSTYKLLEHIKHQEPDAGIRVFINPKESDRKNLCLTHGMARILNLREILEFLANGHGDLKYSLLVKGENGAVECYNVRGGKVKCRTITRDSEEYDASRTVISQKDMSCVLFRRPDTGSLILEAFGMPSLGGYLSLMLD